MIRKFMIVLLCFMLAFTSTLLTFAADETEGYVDITSPKVGESGKTILNDSLFISIYVKSEENLFLSLKKKTPTFVFEDVKVEKMVLLPINPSDKVVEEIVEEKVSLSEVAEIIPPTKDEIVAAYQMAGSDLEIIKSDYEKAQAVVDEIKKTLDEASEKEDSTFQLSQDDEDAIGYWEAIKELYNFTLLDYEKKQKEYNDLFEKDVFDQQEMIVDASFPYFEYTVSDIEPGQYILVVTNLEGKVIKKLEFEVITEAVITDQIIENNDLFGKIIPDKIFE